MSILKILTTVIKRQIFRHLGRTSNTKNRVGEEWTYTQLSIKSDDIGHNGPWGQDTVNRGFMLVAFKPAVNSARSPLSVLSNFATLVITIYNNITAIKLITENFEYAV